MNNYHKKKTLAAKRIADFVREHPEGVTHKDLDEAGIPMWGMDLALKHGNIKATQVREPERGPRCYHWLWRSDSADNVITDCRLRVNGKPVMGPGSENHQ